MRTPEVELGRAVRGWLQEQEAEIYQEVEGPRGRCDLVAVMDPVVAVFELKTQLSFELLSQARRWRDFAHQVWVGVPAVRRWNDGRHTAHRVFEDWGLGVIEVQHGDVRVWARPSLNRRADVRHLCAALSEEQKTLVEAGTARGGHWTTFKATCRDLRAFVESHPGSTLGEALKATPNHYRSIAGGRSALSRLIQRGVVPGLRLERDGRALRLFTEKCS